MVSGSERVGEACGGLDAEGVEFLGRNGTK